MPTEKLTEEELDKIESDAMEAAFTGESPTADEDEQDDQPAQTEEMEGQDDEPEPEPEPESDAETLGDEEDTEQEQEPEPDEQSDAQAQDEPELSINEQLLAMKQEVDRLSGSVNSLSGTVGGLKGYVQQMSKKANAEATKAGGDTPDAAKVAEAMKDTEAYAALKEEFPEWGEAMDAQMAAFQNHLLQKIPKVDPSEIINTVSQRVRAEIRQEFALREVEQRHAGWQQTVKSESFGTWLSKQPDSVQALASSDEPQDAIALLDKFKDATAAEQRKQKSTDRLKKSVAPTDGSARRGTTGKRPMTEDEAMEMAFQNGL